MIERLRTNIITEKWLIMQSFNALNHTKRKKIDNKTQQKICQRFINIILKQWQSLEKQRKLHKKKVAKDLIETITE